MAHRTNLTAVPDEQTPDAVPRISHHLTRSQSEVRTWPRSSAEEPRDPGQHDTSELAQRVAFLEDALAATQIEAQRLEQLFYGSPEAIAQLDAEACVVDVNPTFERLFGYVRTEILGRPLDELIIADGQPHEAQTLTAKVLGGKTVEIEATRFHRDGSPVEVRLLAYPINDGATTVGLWALYRNLGEVKRDGLTGLAKRSAFLDRLGVEIERASRSGTSLAVLVIDVDGFRDIIDAYGIAAGDWLLASFASRLESTLRRQATLARTGGDEFTVTQTQLADIGNAAGLARRLLAALKRPFPSPGHTVHMTASIGIAVLPAGTATDARRLAGAAQRALIEARSAGGNTFRFHDEGMDRTVEARVRLGEDLHGALERGELYLEYQPQVELATGKLRGVEALVRWRHRTAGLISPAQFIPIAEAGGAISSIGLWILETACREARAWSLAYPPGVPVAVNVSAAQLRDPLFVGHVTRALVGSGLDPASLELELTESVILQDSDRVVQTLRTLQDLGVRLALDDFGTGFSSFDHLRRLPIHRLKIDRSFVSQLAEPEGSLIVRALAQLGATLGLQVLAEGAETRSQIDFLAAVGIREVQGFFYSRPVAATKIASLLLSGGVIDPESGAAAADCA